MKRHCVWAVLCLLVLLALLLPRGAGAVEPRSSGRATAPSRPEKTNGCRSPETTWTPRLRPEQGWPIERVDAPKDFGPAEDRSLVLDTAGHPHIAYGKDHLYYAWHDGATWHIETVDPSLGVGEYAALALDGAGRPHISYYDSAQEDLKYAYFDGSAWQIQTLDANVGSS